MNNQKLQKFIDLVTFDQNLITLENSIDQVEQKVTSLQRDLEQLQQKYQQKEERLKESKKNLDLYELNVKSLQEKEAHQATVLEKAKSTKEYDAASKELDHLKIERDQAEQKLLQMWNGHEQLEKDFATIKKEQEEKNSQIQETIATEKESLDALQKDLSQQNNQRESIFSAVPQDWTDLYDNMRGKVSNPVVEVVKESCGACYYVISSRDLQTLRQGELVQCKDCYRFLYLDADSAQA